MTFAAAAINVGTEYSGWGFSFTDDFKSDPTKPMLKNWYGPSSISHQVAPTNVLIKPDGQTLDSFGYDASNKYTQLAVDGDHKEWYFFQGFPMMIFNRMGKERNVLLEDYYGKKLPAKTVLALVIQYLHYDVLHVVGMRLNDILETSEINWVLTVPASSYVGAKQFMTEAAVLAKIPGQNLSIVSETQAALVYCRFLSPWKRVDRDETSLTELKIGTKYIVLDARETSVDFTVHEILSVNKVRELLSSRIDCGSTNVDEAFENFLGEIFGKAVIANSKDRNPWDFKDLLQQFDLKKNTYVYNSEGNIAFRIPMCIKETVDSKNGNSMRECVEKSRYKNSVRVNGDKLRIDAQVMRSFYENFVTNIICHIESLLKNPITSDCSAIVMVGGFSESVVIQECIQEKFSELKVFIPEDAGLAVLRGAVILGHNPLALDIERTETNLPLEILQTDRRSIEQYKQALLEGTEAIHNIRVMIVGHFGVGKTTLTKRLLGEDVNMDARQSTDGIEVHVKRCKVDIESGNWSVRSKGEEDKSIYRRLAVILKQINTEKDSSTNTNYKEIQLAKKNINEESSYTLSTANQVAKLIRTTEKLTEQDKTSRQKTDEHPFPPKPKSLSLEASRQQLNQPDKPVTAKPKDETRYFESLAKELQELTFEDNTNKSDVSIWDFAGQYVFYDTHQVFLSSRTIYLVLTDVSKTLEDVVQDDFCYPDSKGKRLWTIGDFVAFWLRSIHEFCTIPNNTDGLDSEQAHVLGRENPGRTIGPPVILVGTFADKLNQSNRKQAVDIFFSRLREMLVEKNVFVAETHLIENDFDIDNTLETGTSNIESLKKEILETAKLQRYWGEHVPARWTTLENVIVNLRSEGLKVLRRLQLKELNSQLPAPIQKDEEIEAFLKFHHECGNIIYYSSHEDLKQNIILDPQWLVNAFKCLITAESFCRKNPRIHKKWIDFNKTAVFDRNLIDEIWNSQQDSDFKDHKDLLLNFLERLGLIVQHNQTKVGCAITEDRGFKEGNTYLAPCMLKDVPPADLIENTANSSRKTTSKLCFTTVSGFLPTSVFNRLLAACIQTFSLSHHNTKYHIYCGCGIFDVPNNHEMVVFFHNNLIQIWLSKYSTADTEPDFKTCFELLHFVTTHLKRYLTTLKIYVKCPDASVYSDDMFEMDTLLKQKEIVCGCKGRKHAVLTDQLTKYWRGCLSTDATPNQNVRSLTSPPPTNNVYNPRNIGHRIPVTGANLPSYKMDRHPRGWCIIINIETFSYNEARIGTQHDKDRLKEVFQDKLHFIVECRDNLTSTEMMRYLVDISHNIDHTSSDCFVCCILSHGDLGHVYGSDDRAVPIKDITAVFNANRCPSLGGKPKLFFIQACQGNTLMAGVTVATNIQRDASREETIPLDADFLFGYATVPGYVSYRQTESGSWYMRALCHALTEYHNRYHLLEILTEVNRKVAQESEEARGGVYKQIPAPQSTLTKLLYFR